MSENKEINKVKEIFEKNRDKTFIIDAIKEKEFTYSEIGQLSLKIASNLNQHNIKKGDKIAIIPPNCIEYIIIYFSCMQIGAIPVPINIKLSLRDKEHIPDIKFKSI